MINKDTNETSLTQNQVAYLQSAIKGGDGQLCKFADLRW